MVEALERDGGPGGAAGGLAQLGGGAVERADQAQGAGQGVFCGGVQRDDLGVGAVGRAIALCSRE
ncbi:hypothetical protein [Malikia sp.]|uniref:hypothetical protein n=1 Tax=Malikia sp. TaxID=2070706 RepID=UPI0026077F29|nr:hypothetical protein [Malikia sp.]MDD2730376.1 hypothetical protein [Malikia sp.]